MIDPIIATMMLPIFRPVTPRATENCGVEESTNKGTDDTQRKVEKETLSRSAYDLARDPPCNEA
jgi:hypothetical protein